MIMHTFCSPILLLACTEVLGDFICSLFLWPQVLAQMRQHCVDLDLPNDKAGEDTIAYAKDAKDAQVIESGVDFAEYEA
jgi:hypothetical protein